MEVSSEGGEIPMPINSVFSRVVLHGHAHQGHMMTHQHPHQHDQETPSRTTSHDHINNNNNNFNGSNGNGALNLEDKHQEVPYSSSDKDCNNTNLSSNNVRSYSTTKKLMIKFKECLKNHAASMGGNATDGCGEFMPSGEEGTLEALTCSACNCHRNFHRKEIVGENQRHYPPHSPHFYLSTTHHQPHHILGTGGRKVILGSGGGQGFIGHSKGVAVGVGTLVPMSRAMPISVPFQVPGPSATPLDQSDDHDHGHDHKSGGGGGGGGGGVMVRQSHNYQLVKKRYRTKFSQEQKEKMLEFAEKVGWKIQRQEDCVVQQFCQEIGVKRRVLKVWMHNNKLTLANKKNHPNTTHHEDNNHNNNINSSLV